MEATRFTQPVSQETLLSVYMPLMRAFTLILGIYYVLISGAHLAVLQGPVAWALSAIAGISAIIMLTFRFVLLKKVRTMAGLEISALFVVLLPILNVTCHTYLANDPSQFVYLLILALGVSLVSPSLRVVLITLATIALAAIFLSTIGPPEAIITNAFTTFTAMIGGYAIGSFLHTSIRNQVNAAELAQKLLVDVEEEGRRNKALAEEANLANFAKADFLANMSHELRTPLNGVVGIAHALIATELSPQQREMVELIENSGQTLTRLLSDILDFSKIEAGKVDIERAPFDLREQIDAAAFLMKSKAAEKALELTLTYSDTATGWIEGDVTRIKQIIANLASNAIKFTEQGQVNINVSWSEDNEILDICVTDTGIGFDEDAGRRLFQRFVQADSSITRRFGGTGLGLAICRGLVDAMGGGINWTSVVGKGTSFTIRLPAPPAEAPAEKEVSSVGGAYGGDTSPLRILAAEDHPTNQRVLSMILEPMGVDLVICENGATALEAFKASAFDLVLMDMQMPIMDGLAATRAIRLLEHETGKARTPIIMLTANAMRQHRENALAVGADWHVTKPFTPASLISAIETALDVSSQASQDEDIATA
jgi:signal transduction histidine kinase/AmiR/NasT family two-component response regulator